MKDIRENQNNGMIFDYSWIKGLNIIKILATYNLICRLNAITNKIPTSYFVNI